MALEVVAEGVLEVRMRSSEGRALGAAEVEELQRLVQRGQQGAGEQREAVEVREVQRGRVMQFVKNAVLVEQHPQMFLLVLNMRR
jgi:hypothetical protein